MSFCEVDFEYLYKKYVNQKIRQDEYFHSNCWKNDFDLIRRSYEFFEEEIKNQHKKDPTNTISPYFLDWKFTPIERDAWNQIRYLHNTALYPQYPLGKYFIDFANPFLKVAIEMDGRDFHNEITDRKKNEFLKELGYKVFRIPGNKCFKNIFFQYEDIDLDNNSNIHVDNKVWFMNTCDGIITAISVIYFGEPFYNGYKEYCAEVCETYKV